jgi:predicted RNA-binding protein associated with RNAse of E/G family
VIVTEVWRDRLWSAVPHRRVAADGLVTFACGGTRATYATSRGIPGRENLTRAQRKLEAMRTCMYNVVEISLDVSTLNFFREGSWARVTVGWDGNGTFLGWYVNFELPPQLTDSGIQTMDLILDAVVTPEGEWQWKDREDFDIAVAVGVLDASLPSILVGQASATRRQLDARVGPFASRWLSWTPPPTWTTPPLPDAYAVGGAAWTRR